MRPHMPQGADKIRCNATATVVALGVSFRRKRLSKLVVGVIKILTTCKNDKDDRPAPTQMVLELAYVQRARTSI